MTTVVDSRVELNTVPPNFVYIGRGTGGQVPSLVGEYGWAGNPFHMQGVNGRVRAIRLFQFYFFARVDMDPLYREAVLSFRGKVLGCWCKPKACHGDVYAEYLDNATLFS